MQIWGGSGSLLGAIQQQLFEQLPKANTPEALAKLLPY